MCSAEPLADEAPLSSVVVGGGPGGMGPLLWAAQNGLLDAAPAAVLPDLLERVVDVVRDVADRGLTAAMKSANTRRDG